VRTTIYSGSSVIHVQHSFDGFDESLWTLITSSPVFPGLIFSDQKPELGTLGNQDELMIRKRNIVRHEKY
jgi:hypothetical protein